MNSQQRTELLRFLLSIARPEKLDIRERWYRRSYPVLARQASRKDTPAGLVQVMAYAGSWVNVIPPAQPTTKQAEVDTLIRAFEDLDAATPAKRMSKRLAVLRCAEEVFGTKADGERIVLLSKALHFLRPGLAPMIDRRVGSAWEGLWERFRWLQPASIMSGVDPERRSFPTKTDYLSFWEEAYQLVRQAKRADAAFNYRQLDEILFYFGKQVDRERRRSKAGANKSVTAEIVDLERPG